MALLSSNKKLPKCSVVCLFMKTIVGLLLTIAAFASLAGVYETHVITGSPTASVIIQFGSTSGSLAIIAFVLALTVWLKTLKSFKAPCEVCSRK